MGNDNLNKLTKNLNLMKMNRKKRNLTLMLTGTSVFLLGIICNEFGITESVQTSMNLSNVEAISSCEIEKNGTIYLQCTGEEGVCTTSKWGYTLTCSGKKNAPKH